MTTATVDVLKAQSWMDDIIDDGTHCWMDPQLADALGLEGGEQLRVIRNSDEYAIYTLTSLFEDGDDDNDIRMGLAGRERVGTSDSMSGVTADTQVPHPTYDDADAESNSEFVERLVDDGSSTSLVVCAAHGGWIERYTDDQAVAVQQALSAKGASSWLCKGYRQGGGAYDRWHITSTEISPDSFPGLGSIQTRGFQYALSFHGFSGNKEVLVGGGAPDSLKDQVIDAIKGALPNKFKVKKASGGLAGESPDNFCNWLTAGGTGGIQVEQTYDVRKNHWQDVADALAQLYDTLI